VWDVPTNTCVDWLGFHTPPTSLTVSPTGEFLATTHVDKISITLWSDQTFYHTVHMDGAHPPTEPTQMDNPVPIAETSTIELLTWARKLSEVQQQLCNIYLLVIIPIQ
jgi:U3 small nucleolar RNA-associated protein 21